MAMLDILVQSLIHSNDYNCYPTLFRKSARFLLSIKINHRNTNTHSHTQGSGVVGYMPTGSIDETGKDREETFLNIVVFAVSNTPHPCFPLSLYLPLPPSFDHTHAHSHPHSSQALSVYVYLTKLCGQPYNYPFIAHLMIN